MRILPLLIILLLAACKSQNDSLGPTFEESDFVLTPIIDSPLKRATKYKDDIIVEQGTLLNNRKHGTWTVFHPIMEGRIERVQNFEHGRLHGATLEFHSSGYITSYQDYIHGQADGQKINLNYVKTADITPYAAGKIHGTFKGFFGNGKLQQTIEYKEGKKDGYLTYYDETGKATLRYLYENDVKKEETAVE